MRGMKSWSSLSFILSIFVLSACQQFAVTTPVTGRDEFYRSSISVSEKDGFDLEVHFPDGRKSEDPDSINIIFSKKSGVEPGSTESFWYQIGIDMKSPIIPTMSSYEPYPQVENRNGLPFYGKLKVFLSRNLERLPTYQASKSEAPKLPSLMLSISRMVRENKKFLRGTVSTSYCNAVLVSPNQVLTNEHCVKNQVDCDTTSFVFATKDIGDVLACSKFLHSEPQSDQVLLELERDVKAPFIPITYIDKDYSFPKQSKVWIASTFGHWTSSWFATKWNVSTKSKESAGAKLLECHVENGYYFTRGEAGDLKTSNYSLSCPVIHGQSGSAVISSDGTLLGLLWAKDATDNAQFIPLDSRIREKITNP